MKPKWKCETCGTTFPKDELKVYHLCSRVARSGMPGIYGDCPRCGREQPVEDLDPPPPLPTPPGYKGPRLVQVKPPGLIDNETMRPAPATPLFFFRTPDERRPK